MEENYMAEMKRLAELCVKMEGVCLVLAEREDEVARHLLAGYRAEFNRLAANIFVDDASDATPGDAGEADGMTDYEMDQEAAVLAEFIETVLDSDDEEVPAVAPVEEPVAEPEVTEEEPLVTGQPDTEVVEEVSQPKADAETEPEAEPEQPGEAQQSEAKSDLRVDEMLSRREARELRKAFTLNDKFRFRRELFNNDNDKFRETLERIEKMHSNEEAVAYMTGELGWNLEDEAPSDFASTVANHFAGF